MKLEFRTYGEGAPIIILHGLFGASDNWMSVAKLLADSYKVYLVDQRNHGNSGHSNEWTYDAMAEDLKQFITDHEIKNPILMGHSMGGKTVMKYSFKYPSTFKKMIVVDIGPKYYPVHHRTILDGLLSINLSELSSRGDADKILANYVPEAPVRQFLLKNLKRTGDSYEWKVNLKVINDKIENVGEELTGKYDGEVLFVNGANSDYIKKEDWNDILSKYPNATLTTINGAGHWVHAEKPEEFIEEIQEFISA